MIGIWILIALSWSCSVGLVLVVRGGPGWTRAILDYLLGGERVNHASYTHTVWSFERCFTATSVTTIEIGRAPWTFKHSTILGRRLRIARVPESILRGLYWRGLSILCWLLTVIEHSKLRQMRLISLIGPIEDGASLVCTRCRSCLDRRISTKSHRVAAVLYRYVVGLLSFSLKRSIAPTLARCDRWSFVLLLRILLWLGACKVIMCLQEALAAAIQLNSRRILHGIMLALHLSLVWMLITV